MLYGLTEIELLDLRQQLGLAKLNLLCAMKQLTHTAAFACAPDDAKQFHLNLATIHDLISALDNELPAPVQGEFKFNTEAVG